MFVQQFVTVDQPLRSVVDRFEREVAPQLGRIIDEVWHNEGHIERRPDDPNVEVTVGARRDRADGVVYAVSWPTINELGLPEVDADLELAELSPERTHVQFSGQSRFPTLARWSDEEMRAHRRGMSAIAAVLTAVAAAIDGART
jgi:hypothetical protein